jgi:hypothetical protein
MLLLRGPVRLHSFKIEDSLAVLRHLPGQPGEPALGLLAGVVGDCTPASEYLVDVGSKQVLPPFFWAPLFRKHHDWLPCLCQSDDGQHQRRIQQLPECGITA